MTAGCEPQLSGSASPASTPTGMDIGAQVADLVALGHKALDHAEQQLRAVQQQLDAATSRVAEARASIDRLNTFASRIAARQAAIDHPAADAAGPREDSSRG